MQLITQMLPSAITAALVANTVMFLLGRLRWFKSGAATAAGVAIGYATGHSVTGGLPAFPVIDATHWLFYFALTAGVLGFADAKLRCPAWLRLLVWTMVSAALLWLLLRPVFEFRWSTTEGVLWVAAFALGLVLLTVSFTQTGASPEYGSTMPLFCSIVAAGTSGALMLSGSLLLAEYAAVLGAVSFAAAVLGYFSPNVSLVRGGPPVFAVLLSSLWLSGYFYAELPVASVLILMVASAVCLPARWQSIRLILLQGGFLIGAAIAAIYLAYQASPPLSY